MHPRAFATTPSTPLPLEAPMRSHLLVILSCIAIAACGADDRRDATALPHPTPTPQGGASRSRPAPPPPALPAPSPALPAASSAEPDRGGCAGEVNYPCPDGFEDGCIRQRTTEHVCVAKDAEATIPCDRPATLGCKSGMLDACAAAPPYGKLHICVIPVPNRAATATPASSGLWALRIECRNEIKYSCPSGLENGCIGARTTSHVCVESGAKATVPCDQPATLACKDGMVDACTTSPPFGTFHVCVKPRDA
ncbi:MAG: hypothetical protein SFX73_15025 [Kofleriaceae bacterium]|nr:hypothetical protein [Kofleriaceae bacterium]